MRRRGDRCLLSTCLLARCSIRSWPYLPIGTHFAKSSHRLSVSWSTCRGVREHYFADFTEQVSEVVGADLMLTVADGQGRSVAGPQAIREGTTASDRSFELAFFDSDLMLHIPDDLSRQPWALSVSAAGDLSLSRAIDGANRTMIVGAVSAMALTLGLVLALRADRRAARLASLRSDFVSTVTHELKTPIAAIRAAAETLAQGRLPRVESYQVLRGICCHAREAPHPSRRESSGLLTDYGRCCGLCVRAS